MWISLTLIEKRRQIIVEHRAMKRNKFIWRKRSELNSLWSRRVFRSSSTIDLEKKDNKILRIFDWGECSDHCRRSIETKKKFIWRENEKWISLTFDGGYCWDHCQRWILRLKIYAFGERKWSELAWISIDTVCLDSETYWVVRSGWW